MTRVRLWSVLAILLAMIVAFAYVGWYFTLQDAADPCRNKTGFAYVQCKEINR